MKKIFVIHINVYWRASSVKKVLNNSVDNLIHHGCQSASYSRHPGVCFVDALQSGHDTGMEVMYGLSNMDPLSPRLVWILEI